jgi:hypothetical protein
LRRISVRDEADMANARFMESYESRHSDHSFTAAVVRSKFDCSVAVMLLFEEQQDLQCCTEDAFCCALCTIVAHAPGNA